MRVESGRVDGDEGEAGEARGMSDKGCSADDAAPTEVVWLQGLWPDQPRCLTLQSDALSSGYSACRPL